MVLKATEKASLVGTRSVTLALVLLSSHVLLEATSKDRKMEKSELYSRASPGVRGATGNKTLLIVWPMELPARRSHCATDVTRPAMSRRTGTSFWFQRSTTLTLSVFDIVRLNPATNSLLGNQPEV